MHLINDYFTNWTGPIDRFEEGWVESYYMIMNWLVFVNGVGSKEKMKINLISEEFDQDLDWIHIKLI